MADQGPRDLNILNTALHRPTLPFSAGTLKVAQSVSDRENFKKNKYNQNQSKSIKYNWRRMIGLAV